MPTLILIKHALPQIDPTVPANQWRLSEEGQCFSRVLAQRLAQYELDLIFSSVEPKAIETAHIVATALEKRVEVVEGLHEHDRNSVEFLEKKKFEASVFQFFNQPGLLTFGNETANQAHHRFSQAVMGIIEKYPDKNIALVTHGTVLTLFVSHLVGIEPFAFWKGLALPSWVVLSHPDLSLRSVCKSINNENANGDNLS
ncbi:MAG: phosphoglycerate mutase family protein [Candidatus Poribacteria bacterium]|nr:phosphoglycerate mutase family protein [Candidatus Poribacteria bacterium]